MDELVDPKIHREQEGSLLIMALEVDIEKRAGKFHLRSRFEAGNETMAILGASGCGKSMTLKCIAGVMQPDRGRIVLNGRPLYDSDKKINIPARRRSTGYLFQNYALFPNMTVAQNIGCGIPKRHKNRAERVREKIAAFYLDGLETQYPAQLSGGQQQRVALARMLASEPELLMLDEPFSALDSYLKWQLEQELLRILEDFGGTVLFVSHNRDEVFRLCDRVTIMKNGRTQEAGSKREMFLNPQTLSATLLSGCKNVSRARKTGDRTFFALDWGFELDAGRAVSNTLEHVGFRAHFFEVVGQGETMANVIEWERLLVVEDMFSIIVMVRAKGCAGDKAPLRCEFGKDVWARIKQAESVYLRMPPDKLILIG